MTRQLVIFFLGDPYLGNKIKMYATCAELQEAVNHAAYALHYPFVDWPNEFEARQQCVWWVLQASASGPRT